MSENYLMLNGKRIDLTKEQICQLGLEPEKNDCFKRNGARYYYINSEGEVDGFVDNGDTVDDNHYNTANYCTDVSLLEQRALHETLDRLLWRFSMQNDGDKIDWSDCFQRKYYIYYDNNPYNKYTYEVDFSINNKGFCIYFSTKEIAQRAINEIILPFMEEHPGFIW